MTRLASLWPPSVLAQHLREQRAALEDLDMLIEDAPTGKLALRTICEDVTAGASMPAAFEAAFGISLEAFYAQFEEWRQSQL